MQFAHSSALRERSTAPTSPAPATWATRSSTTRALIREILALRQEEAQLLGYRNFGEVSVVPKMAESPEQVISFLRDLGAPRAGPTPRSDLADLRAFAAERAGPRRPAGLGLGLHRREAQGSALCLQRAGGQAVLHRAQGAGRPVQDRRDAVRGGASAATRRRCGIPSVRVLPHRARRPDWSASSTSTRRRAPASAAAPGWTTCAPAGCAPTTARCRRRSPTWSATSPRASTASRRC